MSFETGAAAYDRFMGKYSNPLAPLFADFAGVTAGQRVLDVGCGPGALTGELVRRVGADSVSAVDPTAGFVAAAAERNPGVDVRRASAEQLPHDDDAFDTTLAQLVVHFMKDPVAGLREMSRVTRPGGVVAACVWDHQGDQGPISLFWAAARHFDADIDDESRRPGAREGHLGQLFRDAGISDVEETVLTVNVEHDTFDAWWEPFTLGVGPAGVYAARLDDEARARLRDQCRALLPSAPFVIIGRAWTVRGRS